jgi:hypothetical protein
MPTKKKAKTKKRLRVAATLTVNDLGKMTVVGRKKIAQWLRSRANVVERHGDLYADVARFRQFYVYTDEGTHEQEASGYTGLSSATRGYEAGIV